MREEEDKINNQDKDNKNSGSPSGVGIFTKADPIESKIAAEVNEQQKINNQGTQNPSK